MIYIGEIILFNHQFNLGLEHVKSSVVNLGSKLNFLSFPTTVIQLTVSQRSSAIVIAQY